MPLTKHSEPQYGPPLFPRSHPVFSQTADKLRFVPDRSKHLAKEEQIAGLYGLDIGAELIFD